MTIAISKEVEALITETLGTGKYGDANDVLLNALHLLHERDDALSVRHAGAQTGLHQAMNGDFSYFDELDEDELFAEAMAVAESSAQHSEP